MRITRWDFLREGGQGRLAREGDIDTFFSLPRLEGSL